MEEQEQTYLGKYFNFNVKLIRFLPKIIIVLMIIEVISLWFTHGVNIKSIVANNWIIADYINSVFLDIKPENSYHPWTYNLTHFLTDKKKILPYTLVLIWLLVFRKRNYLFQSLNMIPISKIKSIFLAHLVFSGVIFIIYNNFLWNNEHGHFVGDRSIGLFSSFNWLIDSTSEMNFFSFFWLFIYRLSYIININLMILFAPFIMIITVFAGIRISNRKKDPVRSLYTDFLNKKEKNNPYWKLGMPKNDLIWLDKIMLFLVGMCILVLVYFLVIKTEGRVSVSGLNTLLLILLILLIYPIVYLWKRRSYINLRKSFFGSVVLFFFLILFAIKAGNIVDYIGNYLVKIKHESKEELMDFEKKEHSFVSRAIGGIMISYLSSQSALDNSRIFYEKLKRVNREGIMSKENPWLIFLIYLARLERLEQLSNSDFFPRKINTILSQVNTSANKINIFQKPSDNFSDSLQWLKITNDKGRPLFLFKNEVLWGVRHHLRRINRKIMKDGNTFFGSSWEYDKKLSIPNYDAIIEIIDDYIKTPITKVYKISVPKKTDDLAYELAFFLHKMDSSGVWQRNRDRANKN